MRASLALVWISGNFPHFPAVPHFGLVQLASQQFTVKASESCIFASEASEAGKKLGFQAQRGIQAEKRLVATGRGGEWANSREVCEREKCVGKGGAA